MATDTKIPQLIINEMTRAQYEALTEVSESEIYVITDDEATVVTNGTNITGTGTISDPIALSQEIVTKIDNNTTNLSTHTANESNPHKVTKAQIGLGNVDNTSDANKPISTATQTALDLKADKSSVYDKTEISGLLETKQDTLEAGDGIEIKDGVISNTRVSAEWGKIEGTLSNQTDLQSALDLKANQSTTYTKTEVSTLLDTKQDILTPGSNIIIVDNVISSTAQESFFRGRFAEWTSVPTSSADYTADFHGNTTPSYNDYIVVEDSSLYIPQDFLSDPNNVMIRNLHSAGVNYTIEVVIQDQIRRIYYTECTGGVYAQINDWLSVTYQGGTPGVWYIKTNKEFYINNVFTPTANRLELLRTNTPYETNFYLSEKPGVAPLPIYGSWRFVYHGVWADDNILGWKPEYQIEETLPMATDTQAGIAKLYTTSGSNSDGAMTQRAVGNAISAHNTATNAHSNIRGVAGGLATLDDNAKVPMSQINDALIGNVSYQGLWNAETNTPFLADPSGDLPAGYTQLKGITGSGNAYIDTGVVATGQKLTYRISFTTTSNTAWKYLFGACTSDTTQSIIGSAGALGFYATSNRVEISAGDRRIQTTYINPVKEQSNAELTIDTQALTYACTINDNLFTGSYTGNVNRERTIHLFDTNRDKTTTSYFTPFAGTIHSFAIEMDGVIVRNMLPARRDSDGVVGMYDIINDVFYGPADVGIFIAVEGDIQLPKGDYYITSVAGDRFGLHFDVGDWVISTGEGWTKVDNTDAVSAVNGMTGNVTLTAEDINALPLTGGTLTGPLSIQNDEGTLYGAISNFGGGLQFNYNSTNNAVFRYDVNSLHPATTKTTLGDSIHTWLKVYTQNLNNGADILIPTEGGTLARIEDIPVSSVNSKTGEVVLNTEDINAVNGEETITLQAALDLKANASDYVQKSGDTMSGSLYFPVDGKSGIRFTTGHVNLNPRITATSSLKISISDQSPDYGTESGFMFDLANGVFYHNNNNFLKIGSSDKVVKNIYTASINNGADLAVPTEAGTLARIEDIPVSSVNSKTGEVVLNTEDINATNGEETITLQAALDLKANQSTTYTKTEVDNKIAEFEAFPDQTNNNGKILTTNGTETSWTDMPGLIIRRL